MMDIAPPHYATRSSLGEDVRRLGVKRGDTVLLHAALGKVGPILGGPDALANAVLDVVGPDGTMMVYAGWETLHYELLDEAGRMPPAWRDHVPGFDVETARAVRIHGVIAEIVRTLPGARRSANPGASMAAIGKWADWITADHPQDYGYGEGSPLAKLVERDGRVLMVGAPRSKMTLVDHAEHIARIPDKKTVRVEIPFASPAGAQWRLIEEFETDEPVHDALPDNHIEQIVTAYADNIGAEEGLVGRAPSLLVDARPFVAFAVEWLEARDYNRTA
jgi:aminoglycoside 3-N-acetyltransferase